ncbi:unnamed protein product [Symbiodinium natans]|uniref:GAR domain-containing protein n=1 Tax=Symbiodinium natans TaxID=878477 RepID=A0A812TK65_9DINO|nr:unnamed protein product [Symbiodinium natans]
MSCFAPATAGPRPCAAGVPWSPGNAPYPNGTTMPLQHVRAYGGSPQGVAPGQAPSIGLQADGLQAEVARRKAAESRVQELEALVARLQNRVAVLEAEGKPKGGPRRSAPARKQDADAQVSAEDEEEDSIDTAIRTYLEHNPDFPVSIQKVAPNYYVFGDRGTVYIQQRGEHVVVRVGGGYKSLQVFMDAGVPETAPFRSCMVPECMFRNLADRSSSMELDAGQVVAVLVAMLIFLAIWAILRPRGFATQLCTCSFVMSLVCTQLLMKNLGSGDLNFRYPATVTSLHFVFIWLTSWMFWATRKQFDKCRPSSLGSVRRYAKYVLPIAASLPLSIALNNTSLLYMGAGLVGIIGTLAPIITAVLTHCLGRRINKTGWIGVGVASLGATCIGAGELKDHRETNSVALGLIFCTASVFLRAAKAVLQDQLLEPTAYKAENKQNEDKDDKSDLEGGPPPPPALIALSPMHVWALQAPPCTLWAVTYALFTESPQQAVAAATPQVAHMILLTCITATILNVLGMTTMKQLGASSMQIIGKLNTIILLAFSMGFWGERLPQEVLIGTCFVLAGVAIFEQRGACPNIIDCLDTAGTD